MRKATPRTLPLCLILLFLMILVNTPVSGQAASTVSEQVASTTTGAMRKAPYLIYQGNNTQMKVLWQLNSTATCTIDWGIDTLYSVGSAQTSEYGSDHQHSYIITTLTPSTKYYYRVSVGTDKFVGSFRAAPPSDTSSTKLIVYGDSRTYPADHDQVANGIVSTYEADSSFQSLLISVGDLTSYGNQESGWDTELFAAGYAHLQTMLATMPFQVAMGNHEESGVLFSKYLPYPFVGGRYWSFDYGPAHFVIVDQYTNYGPGSPQLAWIEDDLDTTTRPWKFICLHDPGWSAGGHPNNTSVQNYIQPLCEEYGVRVLFAGHNHYYARAVVNGVQHITAGGGGAPLYTPNPAYPYVVTATKSLHYCKVEIDSNVFHFTALTPAGLVIDEFTVVGPAFDTTAPQVTLVRPNGGEIFPGGYQDTIKWVATDDASVRYVNIYYSTDGGATFPYTIATKEPNDSVYTWTVPFAPSDSCIVKIVAYDTSHNGGEDTSDAFFSMIIPVDTKQLPEVALFGLLENHPNPFNPVTYVEFVLDERVRANVRVYDISGKVVTTLVNEILSAGRHRVLWSGQDEHGKPVASGIYICRLEAQGKTAIRKMILLR